MSRDVALSVVLVTDAYATIEKVVASLGVQTVRERVELVVVTPARAELESRRPTRPVISRPCESSTSSRSRVAPARAAGVRATNAEIVVIGETHSYQHPAGPPR